MNNSSNAASGSAPSSESSTLGGTPSSGAPASAASTIEITDKAVKEIKRIIAGDPESAGSYLRVQVVGGGCSGMSYKLGFDKAAISASDKKFAKDGVEVIIDPKSFLYLAGTTLDFTDGLNGTGFVFSNPNAKRTCGCGSSFS